MRWLWALVMVAAPVEAQEFTTLKGHGGPVMAIAVSGAGQVATASFDNSVGLWDGRVPKWLDGHAAAVNAVVFVASEGGADQADQAAQAVVSAGDDFSVRLWREATSQVLGRHRGKVTSLAVQPGGMWVASGSWDGTIKMWPLDAGEAYDLAAPGAGVNALAFSQGGKVLYAATTGGQVLRYDMTQPEAAPLPLVRHGFGVNRLVVGEGWLAYGAVDGVTRVIEAESGKPVADFTLERRPVLAMAYHRETAQIAVGDGQGYIMMLGVGMGAGSEAGGWRITRDFRATRRGPVWALAFSRDGEMIWAGGLDDVAYGWPVETLDKFGATMGQERTFLRDADKMPNGERQFMRKCSICHALEKGPSRKAGPSLFQVFGRRAGTVAGYAYSPVLDGSDIIWNDASIDALFDQGPDHYIPGSKMPMQVIAGAGDRADLIAFLKEATKRDTP
ncbi:c-type cytochrome [Rhodobacteraceae bacterium D3-12]|nr:c-type cytochrome [Rhodobacteraceae bacterium D3-12]